SEAVDGFRGTNAAQAERVIVSSDQASVGRDCSLVSDFSGGAYRAICPMWLEGGARVGEVNDGRREFLLEPALSSKQFCLQVAFGDVSDVRVCHRMRPERVAVARQSPHFVPGHHQPPRKLRRFSPQLLL